jgi:hypothetical protein
MSEDPILRLAKIHIVKVSMELEAQFIAKGDAPCLEILKRLRDRAAESLMALALCNSEDPKAIRLLQNEVKRYDEWVKWMQEIIDEGRSADQELSHQEREELLDILQQTPEGQEQAIDLGLVRRSVSDE